MPKKPGHPPSSNASVGRSASAADLQKAKSWTKILLQRTLEMLYIFKKTIETLILRLCIPCSIFTFYTAGYLSRKGLWCVRGLGLSRTCLSASLPLGNSVLSLLLQDPPFCPLPLDNVRVCGHQRVICRRLHIHLYPHQRNRSTHVHSPSVSEDSREIMLGYIKQCSLIIH